MTSIQIYFCLKQKRPPCIDQLFFVKHESACTYHPFNALLFYLAKLSPGCHNIRPEPSTLNNNSHFLFPCSNERSRTGAVFNTNRFDHFSLVFILPMFAVVKLINRGKKSAIANTNEYNEIILHKYVGLSFAKLNIFICYSI